MTNWTDCRHSRQFVDSVDPSTVSRQLRSQVQSKVPGPARPRRRIRRGAATVLGSCLSAPPIRRPARFGRARAGVRRPARAGPRDARPRGRLRPEAARRPAARGAGVPEQLLRRDVEPRARRPSTSSSTPTSASSASACSCRPSRSWPRSLARREPLVTIESQTPVRDFDVFAFSVSFEWDYTERRDDAAAGRPASRAPPTAIAAIRSS